MMLSSFSRKEFTIKKDDDDQTYIYIDFSNCHQSSEIFDQNLSGDPQSRSLQSELSRFLSAATFLSENVGSIPKCTQISDHVVRVEYIGMTEGRPAGTDTILADTILSMGLNSAKFGLFDASLKSSINWLVKLSQISRNHPPQDRYYGSESMKGEVESMINFADQRVSQLLYEITSQSPMIIHRDYQSANILIRDGDTYVIDFQDLCMGPKYYDLASLLYDPKICLSEQHRERLANYYFSQSNKEESNKETNKETEEEFYRKLRATGLFRLLKSLKIRLDFANPQHRIEFKRGLTILQILMTQLKLDRSLFKFNVDLPRYNLSTVVLAAGRGKRMGGDLPKVLQPCLDLPMLDYPLRWISMLPSQKPIIVVGYRKDLISDWLSTYHMLYQTTLVSQEEQRGTGHAVMQVMPYLAETCRSKSTGIVLILAGDVPVLDYKILQSFIDEFTGDTKDPQYAAGILTTSTPSPTGYGRILRDERGKFSGTIEQKDIPEDRADLFAIDEISTGTLIFRHSFLDTYIKRIGCDNKQNEYYLPDVVNLLHKERHSILAYNCDIIPEIHGANDITQLKQIEAWMSQS